MEVDVDCVDLASAPCSIVLALARRPYFVSERSFMYTHHNTLPHSSSSHHTTLTPPHQTTPSPPQEFGNYIGPDLDSSSEESDSDDSIGDNNNDDDGDVGVGGNGK